MSSVEQIFSQPQAAQHASVECERPDIHRFKMQRMTVAEMMANLSYENDELDDLTREEYQRYIDSHQGHYTTATV